MRLAQTIADVWLKFCGGAALLMLGDAAMNFFRTDPDEDYEDEEEEEPRGDRKIL